MFGLLQNRKLTTEELSDFRLNYCGTCKTIGKLYGHKERLFLNFDVVFLSELLAAVNNRKEDFNYIKPYTCLTLPKKEEHIPQFLKYTASVNILLGHYKILDNVNDAKYKFNIWLLFKYLTNSNFRKAKQYLKEQKLPVDCIDKQIKEQFFREKQKNLFDNLQETLKYYSSQTAEITGIIFKHGVSSFNNERLSKTFFEMGKSFGEIVYFIDAMEDYEKDRANGDFNLFLLYDLVDKAKLIEEAKVYIHENLDQIKSCINLLPISEIKQNTFANNLALNVNSKISPIKCCSAPKNCTKKRFSLKERYQYAKATAKNISLKKKNIVTRYSYLTFLTVSLILLFLLFPHLIYAGNHPVQKADCCSGFFEWGNDCSCCGKCCGYCCDGCFADCCGKDGSKRGCSSGHTASDIGNSCPVASCCGFLCCLGACGSCIPAASVGPKVIVKIIEVPAKACCDR